MKPAFTPHYRGTDEARIHSTFNKAAINAQGGSCGPKGNMYPPFKCRVNPVARLDSTFVSTPEGRIGTKRITVDSEEAILGITTPGR